LNLELKTQPPVQIWNKGGAKLEIIMASRIKQTSTPTENFAELVPRPWVGELYPQDGNPPPASLLESSYENLSTNDVTAQRYYSYEWHRREVDQMWKKTWQMACRVEDIPEVGDYTTYDIVDDSVIVVRTSADQITAYANSCLHRGTTLTEGSGTTAEFRCPYHGWIFRLDGSLKYVPGDWDFSHLDLENTALPKVKIGFWGGFVFVNLDPDCGPLEDYLDILPDHLAAFDIENRYNALHVSKVVPCNWKVAQEAFIEGYHVAETHYGKGPDGKPSPDGGAASNYDTSIQYDFWQPHVTRMTMLSGVASGYVADQIADEQQIVDAYFGRKPGDRVELEAGETARSAIARQNRKVWGDTHHVDLSQVSDAEVLDQIQYTVFPNFTVWPTIVAPLLYRFRPHGDDPSHALFEVWMLYPKAEDGSHPDAAKELRLGADDLWASVPGLGGYGPVLDQDTPNMPRIQKGLMASAKQAVSLANYQEVRIRAFHETLDRYLAGDL
jgi:phenylpropionate dioxygenase-like ring-hydroxylating dioxygenase large terminal subunit